MKIIKYILASACMLMLIGATASAAPGALADSASVIIEDSSAKPSSSQNMGSQQTPGAITNDTSANVSWSGSTTQESEVILVTPETSSGDRYVVPADTPSNKQNQPQEVQQSVPDTAVKPIKTAGADVSSLYGTFGAMTFALTGIGTGIKRKIKSLRYNRS